MVFALVLVLLKDFNKKKLVWQTRLVMIVNDRQQIYLLNERKGTDISLLNLTSK